MKADIAISVQNVSKIFKIPKDRQDGLKGTLLNALRGRSGYEKFYALKDMSFDVHMGEFVGIVGRNGSGKSTLLKIIAGILVPNSGSIKVRGRIASFLELGLGFQGELTGRENVYLYGAVLGLSKKQINDKYQDIITFSELEKFMNMKLKNYSSGMQARLAFSIAIEAEADILLIDEVLAVGDAEFQKKCLDYFKQIRGKKTILFVSHNAKIVKKFSDFVVDMNKTEYIKNEISKK